MKAATINVRVEPKLKKEVEHILDDLGLTSAEVIRLFYNQIRLNHGLPFAIKIPNKKTVKAMLDAETGKIHKSKSVDTLFEELD